MHKYIITFLLSLILFSCKDNKVLTDDLYISSFIVKTGEGEIKCIIDNNKNTILIPGVSDGAEILQVDYSLPSNISIYPLPEMLINNWDKEERLLVSGGDESKQYFVTLVDFVEKDPNDIEVDAHLYPKETFGRVTTKFFFDIKDGGSVDADKAAMFYRDEGMNGIRVPIYGNYKSKDVSSQVVGHTGPGENEIIGGDYAKTITSIKNAKNFNPDLIVFASKKLNGKFSFASWLKSGNSLNVDLYSEMLLSYLKYMNKNGIEIDVLGIDNEYNFNEGKITPQVYIQIVDKLKAKITGAGLKIPLFIGPERYNPEGFTSGKWLTNLFAQDPQQGRIDIYGTHYYPKHHSYSMNKNLVTEFNAIASKGMEFWATEPHWDSNDAAQADMINHSKLAICAMWDQTDLGMDAFMWWGYPSNTSSLRAALMHDLSNVIYKSQPVRLIDHDGEATLAQDASVFNDRLHSRAFIRNGNEINMYFLNIKSLEEVAAGEGQSYTDYKIKVDGFIDGDVTFKQWTDESSETGEGVTGVVTKLSDSIISIDLPLRSITRITFKIKD